MEGAQVISVTDFLLCIVVALLTGLILAGVYAFKSKYTKSFFLTLAIMPAAVCMIIMMINGNIGTGLAVAGAFGLVRFRSAQGSAKEIGFIFLAMCAGLTCGMGYLAYAVLFTLVLSVVSIIYSQALGMSDKEKEIHKDLRVTIPESLNYSEVFEESLKKYCASYELQSVKTTNMGSLYRLHYDIVLSDPAQEKEMIDKLRQRNGNLEISVSRRETVVQELL